MVSRETKTGSWSAKRRLIGAVACALPFAAASLPQASAQTYEVWGLGNKRCGAWTEAALTDKAKAESYQSWVHAFITGAAFGREGLALRQGADIRPEAITAAVDDYCRKNPLMTVERGAVDVLNKIALEKPKQP